MANFPSPNRSVFISGASSGIGQCCAETLAQKGWRVFAGVRQAGDATRLQTAHPNITPLFLDVTDAASIQAARSEIREILANDHPRNEPCLNGLVNNAGIVVSGPLEGIPISALREQLEINLVGQVAVTQALLPLLRPAQGRIVNMGSVAGMTALPFVSPYSMSKFALRAMSDALRVELRPWRMHVALIEPGSIATPIWEKTRHRAALLSEAFPAEIQTHYGPALQRVEAASKAAGLRGISTDVVAMAVYHALTAKHPKARYLIGRDAGIHRLLQHLPEPIKDSLIGWKAGLP